MCLGTWRSMFICRLNMLFSCNKYNSFPLSFGQIIGDLFYNKEHAEMVFKFLPFRYMYISYSRKDDSVSDYHSGKE